MFRLKHSGKHNVTQEIRNTSLASALRQDAEMQHGARTEREALKAARRKETRSKIFNAMWMAGPAVGIGCALAAALTVGGFSWTTDPLSMLLTSSSKPVFSTGLTVAGLMTAVSAGSSGVDMSKRPRLAKFGRLALTVGGISLAAIGMSFGPMHVIHNAAAATYFSSVPIAMAAMGTSMLSAKESRKLGFLGIATAVAAVSAISASYVTAGRAISEFEITNSALVGGWLFAVGYVSMFGGRIFGRRKKGAGTAAEVRAVAEKSDTGPG